MPAANHFNSGARYLKEVDHGWSHPHVEATAVGVGRPCIFGLAAFRQAGVETVLDILDSELRILMRQTGTPSLAKITKACVVDRSRRM